MKMTTEQLRELDAWIAEFVMGFVKCGMGWQEWCPNGKDKKGRPVERLLLTRCFESWRPTTDPAAAMEVENKTIERFGCLTIQQKNNGNWILSVGDVFASQETRFIAGCNLAKKLFTNQSTH